MRYDSLITEYRQSMELIDRRIMLLQGLEKRSGATKRHKLRRRIIELEKQLASMAEAVAEMIDYDRVKEKTAQSGRCDRNKKCST